MDTNITKKPNALVVLSGGQDSTTCLIWAMAHFNEVHALSFDYGQSHGIELQAARQVAHLTSVKSHTLIQIPNGVLQSTSPLVDKQQPLELYADFKSMEQVIGDRVEKTFVPMRNALFLTIAANHAMANGLQHIVTGVCQEDNANYPDCREDFIVAQERAINEALGIQHFAIHTPLMHQTKASSIAMLYTMGLPQLALLAFTHTAYDGKYPPVGKDHASVLRAQGFLEANMPDPLVLRAHNEGLMLLPDTINYTSERSQRISHDLLNEIRAYRITLETQAPYKWAARADGRWSAVAPTKAPEGKPLPEGRDLGQNSGVGADVI